MKGSKIQSKPNIWVKRGASVIGVFYTAFVCMLSYMSVFYNVVVNSRILLCVILSAISILAGGVMIYSRKQFLTKLCGFVLFPILLPIVLLCFGSWEMIVPLGICAIVIFFATSANEGAKILLGTIYLMIYILAALAYFIFTSFLASPAVTQSIEEGVSPSGKYRYEVMDTTDSSGGCTSVILEPNNMDKDFSVVTFKIKGYDHVVCVKRPKEEVTIEWKKDDMYINDERWFTPIQSIKGKWFDKESHTLKIVK